jgi:hypothetical protein
MTIICKAPLQGLFRSERNSSCSLLPPTAAKNRPTPAPPQQYKAALALVNEAMFTRKHVDIREIEATKDPVYQVWHRVKLKNAPAVTYRAIIEIVPGQSVTLHAVLPKHSRTYEEAHALWLKYRSPK